ncbi:hypothetical protein CC2G_003911 [Coprinopsis cinerea AmutBmut pab1-1]|nr:hypothetical protein CC2G_003911 [Coprinopsis cinerea AmutBmut pab1-1]
MSIPTMAQLQHVQSSAQTNSASGVGSRDIVPPTQTQTQARPGPLPRRLPRKSILKSQRPSLQLNNSLRPLPESITDRFPLELVKLVLHWVVALGSNVPSSPIDYPMRPPNPTLIACSLVCRAWVPLCRTHYTPRLTVTPSNASQFLDLVNGETSGHLTIGQSIKHLVVQKQENVVDHFFLVGTNGTGMSNNRGPTSPGGCSRSSSISSASSSASSDSSASGLRSPYRDTSSPASSSSSLTSQSSSTSLRKPGYDLTDILSVATTRLPSIIKLTLQKAYNQTSQIASYIASFADLEELELRSFEFGTFSDLAAVISAQQGLKRLALTDIAWGPPSSEDSDHGHRPPPNLQTLELFMAHQSHLFEWMFKAPSTEPYTPKISSVDIGGIMQLEDAIAVSRFLRKLGPHLKHLSLYSPSRISQAGSSLEHL